MQHFDLLFQSGFMGAELSHFPMRRVQVAAQILALLHAAGCKFIQALLEQAVGFGELIDTRGLDFQLVAEMRRSVARLGKQGLGVLGGLEGCFVVLPPLCMFRRERVKLVLKLDNSGLFIVLPRADGFKLNGSHASIALINHIDWRIGVFEDQVEWPDRNAVAMTQRSSGDALAVDERSAM